VHHRQSVRFGTLPNFDENGNFIEADEPLNAVHEKLLQELCCYIKATSAKVKPNTAKFRE
jgi:hypothetical protein